MALKIEILKAKIMKRIDEASPILSDGVIASYNIEDFIEDATMQILFSAPLHRVPITDFSTSVATAKPDGSGSVPLPEGFVRLVEFRMLGWERPVHSAISAHNPIYARQFNKFLRGGISKPVVAVVDGKLEYYALPANGGKHTISSAKCVVRSKAIDLPDCLIEPLCWLTASIILMVMNEAQASAVARKRYDEFMIGLYGDDTTNN